MIGITLPPMPPFSRTSSPPLMPIITVSLNPSVSGSPPSTSRASMSQPPMPSDPQVEAQPEEILEVPSPFNRPTADLILRTSDKLDFRVQSQILLEASPVFETLLSLPQPNPDTDAVRDGNPPIIDITESARVLDALMRICYPIVKPKARPFRDIEPVLRAALKYEMELPIAMLSDELITHALRAPLEVWAIACRTGLEDVARRAAEHTLASQTLDIPGLEDLDGITAGHVFRLHEFHRLRGKVDFSFKLLTPPSAVVDQPLPDDAPSSDKDITDVPMPDLCIVSSDGVEFLVHRSVIAMSSTTLQAQVDGAIRNGTDATQQSVSATAGCPKFQVDVAGSVLSTLLKLCYPGEVELAPDPVHVAAVLSASEKLHMDRVRRVVAKRWNIAAKASPLLAFLLATGAGLLDCAKDAAQYALEIALEGMYLRDMENAPALPYHRLLMHYRSCGAIAQNLLSNVGSDLHEPYIPPIGRSMTASTRYDHEYVIPPPLIINSNSRTPSPSPRYGHGYGPGYPIVSDSRYGPRPNAWLKNHLARLSKELEQQPGRVAATTEGLLDAAIEADEWCIQCRRLASELCRVGKALQEIPRKVKEVEFEL